MARTANRYLKLNDQKNGERRVFRVGNYLRLSVDSDYTGSDSLENQRKLAKEYVDRFPDLIIVKEYMDDGRTGTNFERPSFGRMITDLKNGVINCVIVKDLSRFGREYIEAGNYIEKVFPFLGVRFISIVDRYDSEDANCDRELLLIALKNLMHEMYARDISKKVGSTFQMKHQKGIFYRSATIPYGYKMDIHKENYCIDEAPASIVKEIFLQYHHGESRYAICMWLYNHGVLTPAQYSEKKHVYQQEGDLLKVWTSSTVERILKNPVYMGTVLRHKTEQSFYEGKKTTVVPKEEQVVLRDNHPAIISEEIFVDVQEKLKQVKEEFKEYRKDSALMRKDVLFESNVFKGKIFCGDCKTGMTRSVGYRTVEGELERFKVFKCSTHISVPQYCDSRGIEENELCKILYTTIRKHLSLIKGLRKLIDEDIRFSFEEKMHHVEFEKKRIQNSRVLLEQEYIRTYTQYNEENISVECFQKFRNNYLNKMKMLTYRMEEIEKSEKQIVKFRTELKKMFTEWLQFDQTKKLTETMIENCVEKIEVFSGNRIEIKLRYQDQFEKIERWIKEGAGKI